MYRFFLILLPFLWSGCSEDSTSSPRTITPTTGAQSANQIFQPASTSMQKRPMLVIRLEYKDKKFVSSEAIWQKKLFGDNKGELNNYYHEISHNQFEFQPVANDGNVVNGVVTITRNINHPDPNIDAPNFTSILHPELKLAIETLSNDGFDFSVYDTNSDGDITTDELIITFIMAGEEDAYSGGGITDGIWAHQWCTEKNYTPTVNGVSVMGCSYDGNYAIFGERHHDSALKSHDATIGIIAHELGHSSFDLPDLYYGGATRIGYYGLMANGSWGQVKSSDEPGSSPTHMCAWSKIDVGWYVAKETTDDPDSFVPLGATGQADYNIIKTPIFNNKDEYFLIENRGAHSYDEGLKYVSSGYNGGVAIWHIDEETIRSKRKDNTINADKNHKGVDLEEAAGDLCDTGNGDSVKNLYYASNVSLFTPNTKPNTDQYDGGYSYIFITDISSQSDQMSLKINNPKEAP